jgi:hypothetical protein
MEPASTWQQQLSRAGIVVLVSLLIVFLYLMFLAGRFKGVTGPNAMEYAQLARNLAEGEGYTTKLIRPLSLAAHPQIDHHPEVGTAPLHPYFASLLMRMMPDKSRALALSCGLGFLLTVPVVFFLGWQLFDLRTGILATGLYVTNLEYLRQSISGLEVPWLSLWVSLLFLTCYALSRKLRWRLPLAAVSGALVALIYLTQYKWGVILPLVAIYIYLSSDKRTRWMTVGAFVIAWAVVVTPWCIRNVNVTGHPFHSYAAAEMVMSTRTNPGNTLSRQFTTDTPSVVGYIVEKPMEMVQKFTSSVGILYLALIRIAGPYVTPFFIVAVLVTLGSATFERLRLLWYAFFVAILLTVCLVSVMDWVILPLGPFAGVIAAGFFFRLLETRVDNANPKNRARYLGVGIGLLVAMHVMPLGFELFRGGDRPDDVAAERISRASREVASLTSGAIVTDVPWAIAWYADRPAIWLPKTRGDLRKLEDKMGKIRWMVLTPQIVNPRYDRAERTLKEWGYAWQEAVSGDIEFEGYRVFNRVPIANWIVFQADPRAKRDLPPEVMRKYER